MSGYLTISYPLSSELRRACEEPTDRVLENEARGKGLAIVEVHQSQYYRLKESLSNSNVLSPFTQGYAFQL